jgi:hypothetical protein
MVGLAIVWRNPAKVHNRLRCSPPAKIGDRTVYSVQQLLSQERDLWVNTCLLEVVHSHEPLSTGQRSRTWRYSVGW